MIDFFKILSLKGFPVKEADLKIKELSQIKDFSNWQWEQRQKIIDFHINNNQAYRELVGEKISNWNEIPILTKDLIRQYKLNDAVFGNQPDKKRFYLSQTSGSTGKPFVFAKDLLSHALTWKLVENRYGKLGVSINDLQARFYGMPTTFVNKKVEQIKDVLANRERFPVMNLSDEAFDYWIKRFTKRKFKYLYGYSYPLITFSNYLYRKGITLIDICPSLKGCIVTAEMCSDQEKNLIIKTFGVPVANEYGASEFGILGFNLNDYWILSDELMFTEIVDEDGTILPDGTIGNVVCTSLFNQGTPFIRYTTGDLGSISLENGRRVLKNLMGRKEDMAILPSGKKAPGDTVFYYVFKEFAMVYDVIQEYKVAQTSENQFEIRYVGSRNVNAEEEKFLQKLTHIYLEKGVSLKCVKMDILDRNRMGKFRRFVSEIKLLESIE